MREADFVRAMDNGGGVPDVAGSVRGDDYHGVRNDME